MCKDLNAKLRGYDRYDGVHGNSPSLQQCFNQARRILCKWLNRRRQRRSDTWTGFPERLRHFRVERPRLVGRPNTRMAAVAARLPEEPGAGKLHAGICAGAVGSLAVLPRCQLSLTQPESEAP